MNHIIESMVIFHQALFRRDQLIDLFSRVEFDKLPNTFNKQDNTFEYTPIKYIETLTPTFYLGKFITDDKNNLYCVTELLEEKPPGKDDPWGYTTYKFKVSLVPKQDIPKKGPLLKISDVFTLKKGSLSSVKKDTVTTVGFFLFNTILLNDPFGDLFPYINAPPKIGSLEKEMVEKTYLEEITLANIQQYEKNLSYIGYFNELFVPGLTPRALSGNKEAETFKKKYIKENPDIKTDPVKMAQLEAKMLEIDKKDLVNDPSYGLLGAKEGKSIDLCRKEMFLTSGMKKDFTGKQDYVFIEKSFDQGLNPNDIVAGANETRVGVYMRSVDTALGGEIAEWLRRMYQEQTVINTDCRTSRGLDVNVTKDNYKEYMLAFIIENGKSTLLNKSNINKYIGKTIKIRSPAYCELASHGHGVCSICAGDKYIKKLAGDKAMSITMEMTKPGSAFLSDSMSHMHGKKTQMLEINDWNKYLI